MRHIAAPQMRLLHDLESRQSHLLTVYNPAHLTTAVEERVQR